mgnify:CR=1 FL=1
MTNGVSYVPIIHQYKLDKNKNLVNHGKRTRSNFKIDSDEILNVQPLKKRKKNHSDLSVDKASIINVSGPEGDDDTDRGVMKSAKSRSSSVPAHKNRNTFSTPKPPSGEPERM